MRHLSIDIETKSGADITKTGLYRYAQDKDFSILLFAYAWEDEPVQIIDIAAGELLSEELILGLKRPDVCKHAYNAAFEWYCLNQAGYETPLYQWHCTMAHGLYCGYPSSLDAIGKAIGLPEEKKKKTTGKALIRYFCIPCKPTKRNGGRTWNRPNHAPEKWDLFKEYCMQDVEAERSISKRLKGYPMPKSEERQWRMSVEMNTYGVHIDEQLLVGALAIDTISSKELTEEAVQLTKLENPNSPSQLSVWLKENEGLEMPDLKKETVAEYLKNPTISIQSKRVLELRQQLGKTSIKKYHAMMAAKGEDNRIRGLTQYYGANRTGRWAGRLVQLQNLPRNHMEVLNVARELVKKQDYPSLKWICGNVPDALSQLTRTAFIPSKGNKLIVADFSAIEARVIAWLAGEQWVNEVFATHGKIYEAAASQMFHVPVERIVKGNPEYELRQKGKVATLALGYQGGPSALIAMGALSMGIPEEELSEIVHRWRQANPRICDLWHSVEQTGVQVIQTAQTQGRQKLLFVLKGDAIYGQMFLTIQLPSGRELYYPKPFIQENRFGKQAIHYYGINQTTKKWEVNSTYGGKLVENIVQAIARDCLAEVLKRLENEGLHVVFHVHDEVVIDAPKNRTLEEVCQMMAEPISWAPDLLLKGDGFEGDYYKKE